MIKNNIKNSSGKIIGYVEIEDNEIRIFNDIKPVLIISNLNDIQHIQNKNKSNDFLKHLYDDYYMSCGEIAALYGVCYSNINKIIKTINVTTTAHAGRRNRAFGKPVSEEQSKHMSKALQGRDGGHYERTPEIRQKISNSLKTYFQKHPQNPEPHRKNWELGKYKDVDFHRGIGGKFYSIKNTKYYNFRSLLELYYMLQLESDNTITSYQFEPIHIQCEDGTIYTPDILINNHLLIELKSKKYINSLPLEDYNKFLYKVEQGNKYCLNNNLKYQVVYDEDISFDSRQMKKHLQHHPELIATYQITFNQPERIWS